MKILVTGHCGVIGRELIALLGEHEILGIDKACREIVCIKGNLYELKRDLSFDDISEEIRAFEPEIVFHLAAYFERIKETPETFYRVWDNDTLGSHRLLDSVILCPSVKTFVFSSSYLIYNLYTRHALDPRNLCGVSKLYTERELEFVCKKFRPDIRHVNARIYRVYGKGGKEIVSRWCRAKIGGWPTQIFNEKNKFDFIHARDVAEGLKRLAFSKASGIVDIGTNALNSIRHLADLIGISPEKIEDDPHHEISFADTTALEIHTGWKPSITLEEGIKEILEYESNLRNG